MSIYRAVATAVLGCGMMFAAGASQARAQHVVTDAEAGKLTLDALTAAPRPVYRPIYRPIYRPAMAVRRAHRPGYVSRAMHASAGRPGHGHPDHHRHLSLHSVRP